MTEAQAVAIIDALGLLHSDLSSVLSAVYFLAGVAASQVLAITWKG